MTSLFSSLFFGAVRERLPHIGWHESSIRLVESIFWWSYLPSAGVGGILSHYFGARHFIGFAALLSCLATAFVPLGICLKTMEEKFFIFLFFLFFYFFF